MERELEIRKIIDGLATSANDDYVHAFKLLGFIILISTTGNDALLSVTMISPRTYHRWMDQIQKAGYGGLVADASLCQALQEFIRQRFAGLPLQQARSTILEIVNTTISDPAPPRLRSAACCSTVKGVRQSWTRKTGHLISDN